MWPGEQSGGQQQPQGSPTPPQQPPGGYGTPNPYAKPAQQPPQQPQYGYPQQPAGPPAPPQGPPPPPPGAPGAPAYGQPVPPAYAAPTQPYGAPAASPYAQPGYQTPAPGYPTPQQWGPPVPGGGPDGQPPNRRNTTTVVVAVTAALAVVAAVVVGAVYLTGDKKKDAQDDPTPTPTATLPTTPTATPTTAPPATTAAPGVSGGSDDSPRGAPVDIKPVVPGWRVVERDQRNVLFDVPSSWSVDTQGMTIGFDDGKGNPAVAMSAPAYYKHDWCKSANGTADRAVVGTKGANGASSVRNAAEVQAESWAYWAYQVNGKGTFSKAQNSKAFHNSYGINGWQAEATASHLPIANKCSSSGGKAWTVAWLDPTQSDPSKKLVVWVLYADQGVPDQLAQSTIDKIKSTIRLIKK